MIQSSDQIMMCCKVLVYRPSKVRGLLWRWDLLKKKMNSKNNFVLQRTIRRNFQDIKHNGKEPIEEYIKKLQEFQRALKGTPDLINNQAITSKTLLFLPATWGPTELPSKMITV